METQATAISTRQWINKKGEIITKSYNQTKYNTNYYNKNKDELKKHILCDCGNYYTMPNKTNHCNTKIHKLYIAMLQKYTATN
jgi:hypothetical protein